MLINEGMFNILGFLETKCTESEETNYKLSLQLHMYSFFFFLNTYMYTYIDCSVRQITFKMTYVDQRWLNP